jgi:transposase
MEQEKAKKPRRRFDAQFKADAVRLALEGGTGVAQVARNLGIGRTQLDRWIRQMKGGKVPPHAAFPGNGIITAEKKELLETQRELARVKEERDILKKAMAVFSRRP